MVEKQLKIHLQISFVLNDFNRSLDAALTFDSKIMAAANQISPSYADLLALTTRQALSALEVTISQAPNGSWNTSDVKLFVKDMGNMGSRGHVLFFTWSYIHLSDSCLLIRVNAVSVLYSALPLYLFLAPDLLTYLLSPLLEAQRSILYTQPYAAQHLGKSRPFYLASFATTNRTRCGVSECNRSECGA